MNRLETALPGGPWRWAPIALCGGLFFALVASLAAYGIVRDHGDAVAQSQRDLRAGAVVIAEQTAQSLQTVDLVLRQVERADRSGALAAMDRDELRAYLAEQAAGLAQIEGIVLVDASGRVLASSADDAQQAAAKLEPALLQALRSTPGPVIGHARRPGGAASMWSFPVARRLETATGDFAGAVVAPVRVESFQRFYSQVHPVEGTRIELMLEDGALQARDPPADAALGRHDVLFDALNAAGGAAARRVIDPSDGKARFAALAPVPGYPMAVAVTRSVASALAPWRRETVGRSISLVSLGALATLLMVLLRRQLARLDQTRRSLEISGERFALAVAGSDAGIWDWDIAGDHVVASPRALELFGLPPGPESRTRQEWRAALQIHPDDVDANERAIRAHLHDESADFRNELRVRHADGSYRWVRLRGKCVRNAAGTQLRMAGSVADIDAQRRAEDGLRRSEERFALAVAGSDDGVWDFDYVRGEAFASRRGREILGLPLQPEVQTLDEWAAMLPIHPDDAARRLAAIDAHLSGQAPAYEAEWRTVLADGTTRWVRLRGVCVRDADGRPLRMAGSVSDIDERKRAEQARRQSEERFALAVAGSNDGILDWDLVTDSMYVSERARQIAGIDADASISTSEQWTALTIPRLHPDDARRLDHDLNQRSLALQPVHDGEYRLADAAGVYRWVRFRGMNVVDADGQVIRWAGSVSDIDAAKQVEQALRRSEERYQLAVDGSSEGLWDWDLTTDRLFLSPRNQQLLWLEPVEPTQSRRYWVERTRYHPDEVPMLRAAVSAHLRGETQHFRVEYRLQHHSGSWHWYRQRGIAIRDAAGRPTRMAGSMEDITDRKNSEAERERLESRLREAQKLEALGTLAGGIAHDFNNILAAILGYGEMAQKDAAAGSTQRRHIDATMVAALRAKSLVERILVFSRSGVGERSAVHVHSVVAEALDGIVASMPPGIHLERRLESGDAAVLGDPTQVHQVIMNLCTNAIQSMSSSGTLTVTLDQLEEGTPLCSTCQLPAGRYVRLMVRDSGCGIAADVLGRIFDPFFTTREVGVGTGLGLSLVHGIVADLGGGIDVASTVGAGSTFTVFLPWHDTVAASQPADEAPLPGGQGQTILLVDDEDALVRLGEEMLAELGYESVGFTSGLAALQGLREEPQRFDAVLSDEAMPGMTGSELALEIRRQRPDIPIVLMSGYVTPALAERARSADVLEVLSKPLVSRDIARSLAGALQQR